MFKLLKLELHSLRWFFLIPVLVVYGILPLINAVMIVATSSNIMVAAQQVLEDAQKIISLFVVWWPMLVLKEYLNAPGNELLFVFLKRSNRLFTRMLMLWGAYLFFATPAFVAYALMFKGYYGLPLAVASQSLLFLSFAYMLAIIFKNTFLPIIISVLYAVGCFVFKVGAFNIFVSDGLFFASEMTLKYAVLALLSVVFLLIGYICERRIYRGA